MYRLMGWRGEMTDSNRVMLNLSPFFFLFGSILGPVAVCRKGHGSRQPYEIRQMVDKKMRLGSSATSPATADML